MKIAVPKEEFMNKVITESVPLNKDDKDAINAGLARARVNGGTEDVKYTLLDILFLASIEYKKKRDGFVVIARHQG